MTLIIVPRRDVPLVAFNAVLRGGSLGDAAGKPGVASLVAGLLEKGAGKRDAFSLRTPSKAWAAASMRAPDRSRSRPGPVLARDQRLMLELLADALLRPRFDDEELEKLRSRHIEMIKAAKDSDPSELIGTYGRAFLFRRASIWPPGDRQRVLARRRSPAQTCSITTADSSAPTG